MLGKLRKRKVTRTERPDCSFDIVDIVEQQGDYLFRFAVARVRNEAVAEDLVQETFLAALKQFHAFSNRCSMRTWLTSILKNKIFDHFRKSSREELFDFSDSASEGFFQNDGSWRSRHAPSALDVNPADAVENREFWEVVNRGLVALPEKTANAFVLHEIEGLTTEEICKMLQITKNNLWVMLHRARLLLRKEIEGYFLIKNELAGTFHAVVK